LASWAAGFHHDARQPFAAAPRASFGSGSNNRHRRSGTHRITGKHANATMCAAMENRNSRMRPLRVLALRSGKFNIVMIKEGSVERINGLIYSFLGNKEQASAIGIISIYC
jgi:hypothetical protein